MDFVKRFRQEIYSEAVFVCWPQPCAFCVSTGIKLRLCVLIEAGALVITGMVLNHPEWCG